MAANPFAWCCQQKKAKKAVIKAVKGGYVRDPNDFRNQVQGVRRHFPDFTDLGKLKKVKYFVNERNGKKVYYVDDPQEGRLFLSRDKDGHRVYYVDTLLTVLGHEHSRVFVTWDADGAKLHYVEDFDLGKIYIEQDLSGKPLFWLHDIHDDLQPLVFCELEELDDGGLGAVQYFCHPIAISDEVYFNSGFQRTGNFQIFWSKQGHKTFYVADEMEGTSHMRRVIYDSYYKHWRYFRPSDRREDEKPEHHIGRKLDEDSEVEDESEGAEEFDAEHRHANYGPGARRFEHQRTLASGTQDFEGAELGEDDGEGGYMSEGGKSSGSYKRDAEPGTAR
mmetsp:Transcript_5013/g.12608  ORF Transcript_5013/g.12608 Transcript_5013/m.12608 type:complete len:334 (-) Transcript_5013:75-1076(-)|eukprot:CAMPEP_0178994952 /NCGR_PEP_ID=MMETSP0795-20121207/7573_1 /TAXON_ID=88552 /ORGANISM="Amoebophrya sp., Strain Ameob2" /LENGTH=333 /DNA_ID=CAMNT_0020687237 /DNA_START=132 /DNA_END=1133 /DNA_ORIENTATION=+